MAHLRHSNIGTRENKMDIGPFQKHQCSAVKVVFAILAILAGKNLSHALALNKKITRISLEKIEENSNYKNIKFIVHCCISFGINEDVPHENSKKTWRRKSPRNSILWDIKGFNNTRILKKTIEQNKNIRKTKWKFHSYDAELVVKGEDSTKKGKLTLNSYPNPSAKNLSGHSLHPGRNHPVFYYNMSFDYIECLKKQAEDKAGDTKSQDPHWLRQITQEDTCRLHAHEYVQHRERRALVRDRTRPCGEARHDLHQKGALYHHALPLRELKIRIKERKTSAFSLNLLPESNKQKSGSSRHSFLFLATYLRPTPIKNEGSMRYLISICKEKSKIKKDNIESRGARNKSQRKPNYGLDNTDRRIPISSKNRTAPHPCNRGKKRKRKK